MADLAIYLNLDQSDPSLRRVRARGEIQPIALGPFAGGLTLAGELYLLDGTGYFQADSGAAGYAPLIMLSYQGDSGPVSLAIVTEFTPILDGLDDSRIGWAYTLRLNTDAISTWLGTAGLSKSANFDISLANPAGALNLLFRGPVTILPAAFDPAEPTPIVLNNTIVVRADLTSAALHRAVATVGRALPSVFLTLEDSTWTAWTLRARAEGEDDDGVNYRLPDDYNADTNNVIWVRSSIT